MPPTMSFSSVLVVLFNITLSNENCLMRFSYRTDLWVEAKVFINKAGLSNTGCLLVTD